MQATLLPPPSHQDRPSFPLPHASLVHPPIDPDLVELQVCARGERSVLVRRGALEARLIVGPVEPELRLELGRLREQRRRLSGRGTGLPADIDAIDAHCDHLVVWCTESRTVAAAACIRRPERDLMAAEDGAMRAYLRACADGHLDGAGRAFEVHRAFVSLGFGESEAGLTLLRGIDVWLGQGSSPGPRHA